MDNKTKWLIRIPCIVLVLAIVLIAVINTITGVKPKDLNVYLNEEVCFADNVYIKVDKMNVTENDENETSDEDGDILSKYILNLELSVQRKSDKKKNKQIEINPKMFQLKSVNLKSKSKMAVFFESMFKATVSSLISSSVEG